MSACAQYVGYHVQMAEAIFLGALAAVLWVSWQILSGMVAAGTGGVDSQIGLLVGE